jgi:hypothetical protein
VRQVLLASVLALATVPGPSGSLSRRQAQEDLRHLHAALRELHPGLYRYSTRAQVDEAFAQAEAQLPGTVAADELFRRTAALSTVIRDGHTRFRIPASLEKQASAWPLLPLRILVGRGRLFIANVCGGPPGLAGREIRAVDGIPAAEVLARAGALRPRDGSNETYPRWALDQPLAFNEALNLLLGPRDGHRLAVASGETTETIFVAAERREALSACVGPDVARSAALRFHDDDRIAVLSLPTFVPDLSEDYRGWFDTLARRRTRGLVIDLRDNGGGLDRNGSRLFAHLTRKTFSYYDRIVLNTVRPRAPFKQFAELLRPWRIEPDERGRLLFTGHECLGAQQPEAPAFDGPVVVLVNGGTFSAASEFAAVAAAHRRATFVGEETGGAANGNTAGVAALVALPHSGIRVQVPMMRYEVAAPGLDQGRGVRPAVEVEVTVDDRRSGRDRGAEQAMTLVRRLVQEEDKR